jgi:hypothetical protein
LKAVTGLVILGSNSTGLDTSSGLTVVSGADCLLPPISGIGRTFPPLSISNS